MGLNITQLCHLAGARLVIGLDTRKQCLDVAQKLGADVTVNSSEQNAIEAIRKITGGKGVDIAFECASGSTEVGLSGGKTLFEAIDSLAESGRLIQIAFFHDKITLDPNRLRFKSIKYIFTDHDSRKDMETGMNLVARGRVKFSPYITHVLQGIEKLPQAIDITAYKAKYNAINPAVVVVSS